jgi:hypothetical protein
MRWNELIRNDGVAQLSDIQLALKTMPDADAAFFTQVVMPFLPHKKIQAIKEVRSKYEISLKGAKSIVDVIADGATVASCRYRNDALVDAIEATENVCRTAIRLAVGDDKSMAALTGIRQQLSDLWADLIELPSPASTDR